MLNLVKYITPRLTTHITQASSVVIAKLKDKLPKLEYVNNNYVIRSIENSDPRITYSMHYQCEHMSPINCLATFSYDDVFAAAVRNCIWIQG